MATGLGGVVEGLDDIYRWARKAKEDGRKVVGITPMYFPEELVHAAGALPVVLQESYEPITLGFGHLYPFYCGFVRSNVDLAVKDKLDVFDAVVVSDMCLQTHWLGQIMRRRMPRTPFAYVEWPLEVRSDGWLDFALGRLQRVRRELEEILGVEITDAAVKESIALFDEHRSLLKRLYALRQARPGVIKAKEMLALVQTGMVMPKEQHIQVLKEAIRELEQRPVPAAGRVKVFLSGHLCQAVKTDVLDLVESFGAMVVGDDLFGGYRYFATVTPGGVASSLVALAKRYLDQTVPCPTRSDSSQDWGEYVARASRESGAQGVVVLVVKFCEPHMIYYPHLRAVLEQHKMPHVQIETEHEVVSLEGMRTRLQAFVEMLRRS